jgi:hypothetical protein
MKRFDEKIGMRTTKESKEDVAQKRVRKVITVLLLLSLAGCQKAWHGQDGRPGDVYLSLNWEVAEPSYIDAGTGDIPPLFNWGQYYETFPGRYALYYEGRVWTEMGWGTYAWEVDYQMYEIPGEAGGWYYNGQDGPDNYFMIECSPYGPYIENSYKSAEGNPTYEVLEKSDDKITLIQKGDGLELLITYKKMEVKNDITLNDE